MGVIRAQLTHFYAYAFIFSNVLLFYYYLRKIIKKAYYNIKNGKKMCEILFYDMTRRDINI